MTIATLIESLVSYAMNKGLALPEDHTVLLNRLLEALHMDAYEPGNEPQSEDLEEILGGILDYAVEKGLCADDQLCDISVAGVRMREQTGKCIKNIR